MDKPNKTDNAEQPAETADTEGGLTAEKPRSRRKKTSIAVFTPTAKLQKT